MSEKKNHTKGTFSDSLRDLADKIDSTVEKTGSTADMIGKAAGKVSWMTGKVGKTIADTSKKVIDQAKSTDYLELAKNTGENIEKAATFVKEKTTGTIQKTSGAVVEYFDENGNGEIDIEDVIIKSLKIPGVKIKRDKFLEKEFFRKYPKETIREAVRTNPMSAGIDPKDIDAIADEVIEYERRCVSGISAALGAPGGFAMAATIPADIAQYYGYMIRATQKLLYLYGFPEIDLEEEGTKFDSETINILIICFGVMYGAAGANNALKSIAKALGSGVEKQLMKKALTKGTIYPIVKSVAKWFNVKMTKEVFAGFFKKSIPVIGGVIGGGITYLSFKPCCVKLKESLQDTILSNKDYVQSAEIIDIEDAEFEEIDTEFI